MRSFPSTLQSASTKTPEFLKINPAGKLPALVDGDAKNIRGRGNLPLSRRKVPEANLLPRSARRNAAVSLVDGVFDFPTRTRHG